MRFNPKKYFSMLIVFAAALLAGGWIRPSGAEISQLWQFLLFLFM